MKRKAPTRTTSPSDLKEDTKALKKRAQRLYRGLKRLYPNAHCELNYTNPFELLVATILSAQCTDIRVNLVTPDLFAKFPTPKDLARAKQTHVEELIRSTGFYRNKAKSLISTAKDITEKFGGEVPNGMEELLTLRGVARKTANVVLGNAFHVNHGVVVDTHVNRLCNRIGLTSGKNPIRIERDLMALIPQKHWCVLSHLLIWHGRRVCSARKPNCAACTLRKDCQQNNLPS